MEPANKTVGNDGSFKETSATKASEETPTGPFLPGMTIDTAWRRHPGVQAIFASHHLPACNGCAVRFDETLTEAAEAYGIPLEGWLESLNALLQISDAREGPLG